GSFRFKNERIFPMFSRVPIFTSSVWEKTCQDSRTSQKFTEYCQQGPRTFSLGPPRVISGTCLGTVPMDFMSTMGIFPEWKKSLQRRRSLIRKRWTFIVDKTLLF